MMKNEFGLPSINVRRMRRAHGGVRFVASVTVVLLALLLTAAGEGQRGGQQPPPRAVEEPPDRANQQIEAQMEAKAQRTPAQRKVSSQLLDAWRTLRGQPVADERVTVDIRADVTPEVLARIRALGGTVINSVARYRAIRAQLPLSAVEKLAALDAVQSIRAGDEGVPRGPQP